MCFDSMYTTTCASLLILLKSFMRYYWVHAATGGAGRQREMATAAALIRRLVSNSTPMGASSVARITSSATLTGLSAVSRIETSTPTPTPRGHLADALVAGRPDEVATPTGPSALSRIEMSSPTPTRRGYLADALVAGRADEVSRPRAPSFKAAVFSGSLTAPSSNFRGPLTSPKTASLTAPSSNAVIYGPVSFPTKVVSPPIRSSSNWAWTPWEPTKPKQIPPSPQALDNILKQLLELKLSKEDELKVKRALMDMFYTADKVNLMTLDMKFDLIIHKLDEIRRQQDKMTEWGTVVVFGRKFDLSKLVSFLGMIFK